MVPTSRATIDTHQYHVDSKRHLHFYQKGETIPLMSQSIWQQATDNRQQATGNREE